MSNSKPNSLIYEVDFNSSKMYDFHLLDWWCVCPLFFDGDRRCCSIFYFSPSGQQRFKYNSHSFQQFYEINNINHNKFITQNYCMSRYLNILETTSHLYKDKTISHRPCSLAAIYGAPPSRRNRELSWTYICMGSIFVAWSIWLRAPTWIVDPSTSQSHPG